MDVSQLDLAALSRALDDSDPDREHYLEPATGAQWTFVFSEATDETRGRYDEVRNALGDGWIRIPSPSPREAYEEAEDFVEEVGGGPLQDALFAALERKGSLKDFREELMKYPDIRAQWLSLRRRRSRERLEAYLKALGLEGKAPAGDEVLS